MDNFFLVLDSDIKIIFQDNGMLMDICVWDSDEQMFDIYVQIYWCLK